jgi:hypothetical protein
MTNAQLPMSKEVPMTNAQAVFIVQTVILTAAVLGGAKDLGTRVAPH